MTTSRMSKDTVASTSLKIDDPMYESDFTQVSSPVIEPPLHYIMPALNKATYTRM